MSRSKGIFAAVIVVALACGTNDRAQSSAAKDGGMVGDVSGQLRGVEAGGGGGGVGAPVAQSEMAMTVVADTMAAPEPATRPANGTAQGPVTSPDVSAAMIIRTGNAAIKVDSLEVAVAQTRALALSVGGYVANTSMQTGRDQLRSATMEIKVPSARWAQLLTGLKPIGTLESLNEEAQDVGEEFVDAQARVANSRRLEERLISLLATRTGKLQDVLQVERELARVREEIERYEGRMRYLRTRSAISSMTVTVHEPAPVLGSQPGQNPIADAFRDAWRIFVGLVAFLISSLGVILPLALIGWLLWRFVLRRGRKVE